MYNCREIICTYICWVQIISLQFIVQFPQVVLYMHFKAMQIIVHCTPQHTAVLH